MGLLIFSVALVAIVAVIIINGYNDLVKYRNRYKNAYSQIDVQLQRRYDLIPCSAWLRGFGGIQDYFSTWLGLQ